MDNYSSEEAEKIALAFFTKGIAKCPRDDALMKVKTYGHMGSSVQELDFSCERCGSYGSFEPLPAQKEDNWNENQQNHIVEEYWRTKHPKCPNDQARLNCNKLDEIGSNRILINCPLCGRNLDSGNLSTSPSFLVTLRRNA